MSNWKLDNKFENQKINLIWNLQNYVYFFKIISFEYIVLDSKEVVVVFHNLVSNRSQWYVIFKHVKPGEDSLLTTDSFCIWNTLRRLLNFQIFLEFHFLQKLHQFSLHRWAMFWSARQATRDKNIVGVFIFCTRSRILTV